MPELGATVHLACPFDEAIARTTAALGEAGFGIVSRIDLDRAFRDRLGVAFRRYTILGACNPALAHAALVASPEMGLLLPCNVTVEEEEGGSLVRIVDAATMLGVAGLADRPEVAALAADARSRLADVAAQLGSG